MILAVLSGFDLECFCSEQECERAAGRKMNGQHLTLVKPLTLELKLGVNVRGKETLPFDWLRKRGRRLTDAGEGIKTGATQCSN